MSPTQRTLAYLRARGYHAGVVERWNPHAKIRQDALGFADLLAVGPGGILAVQATTADHVAERCDKVIAVEAAREWVRRGGRVIVFGWGLQGPRGERKLWTPRQMHLGPVHPSPQHRPTSGDGEWEWCWREGREAGEGADGR